MFDEHTDGYCPQCMLEGRKEAMKFNRARNWEFPVCRLQAHTHSHWMFALLHERGEGKLTDTLATEYVCGWVLSKDAGQDYRKAEASGFKSEDELRAFLSAQVDNTGAMVISEDDKEAIRKRLNKTFHGKYTIKPYAAYADFQFFFEDRIKKKGCTTLKEINDLIDCVELLAQESEKAGFNIDIRPA